VHAATKSRQVTEDDDSLKQHHRSAEGGGKSKAHIRANVRYGWKADLRLDMNQADFIDNKRLIRRYPQ